MTSVLTGDSDGVRFVVEDGVGHITLTRTDAKNALSVEMRDRLVALIDECRGNSDVRVVLLGAEGSVFCSGMDLRQSTVTAAGTDGFDPRTTSEALRVGVHRIVQGLWDLDKPTIAAVDGPAIGPGAHLALACDFVFTTERASFRWSFSSIGLVVDAGGAFLLPRLVGLPRARAMILLGERSEGTQTVTDGLAYRCVDSGTLATEVDRLAGLLAIAPTRALGLSKRLLNRSLESNFPDLLELEGHFQALATTSHDLVEGMAAFREKRDPDFEGH